MSKPIRVLHVCQRMESAGVQSFIMNVYRNIDRSKVEFDFLVHYKEDQFYDKEIENYGGKIYKLSVREDYNFFKYLKELDLFFKTHKYDVIHGHMDTLGYFYLKYAKKYNIPIRIAHAHTDSVQNGFKKIPRKLMIKLYGKNANYHFACSQDSGNYMFKDDFRVFRNGIDVKRFKYNEETRNKVRKEFKIEDKFVVGNVGRLHVVKNQEFILKLIKELKTSIPNIYFLLIGDGELEDYIISKIKEYDITDNVLMLKNRSDVNELYQAMDIFLLPSLFEGIPLVGIEAQAAGLPCVFSDKVNNKLSVTDNCTFISLDEFDIWKKRIIEIKDKFKRKNTEDSIIRSGYDSYNVAKDLENFYLTACKDIKEGVINE